MSGTALACRTAARGLRSTKSNPNLRSAKSLPNLRRGIRTTAPSTTPSPFLSSPSQYASQSVNWLKTECRRKGLKVSGRKAELVDRLCAHDAAGLTMTQGFSTTARADAKGDASTVDYCIMPLSGSQDESSTYKPVFKIPVPPDAFSKVAEVRQTQYQTVKPDGGHSEAVAGSPATGTEGVSQVHVINPDGDARHVVEAMPVKDFLGSDHDPYDRAKFDPAGEFSSRDKTFLAGVAATVAGWFLLGRKKDEDDH